MNYQQIQPPDRLKNYVRYFWVLESKEGEGRVKTVRPITDGCPGLFFEQAETGTFSDQEGKLLPALFLYGQTIRHRELRTSSTFKAIGACLHPVALKGIFGLDAHELTDACVDVNALADPRGFGLAEQLGSAPSTRHQLALLSAYLRANAEANPNRLDPVTECALKHLITGQGRSSVKALLDTLNVTERSLERRFKHSVGISPHLFARICQFQASLHQLRTRQYGKLSDLAYEQGYADQSHFIRTFKEFTGFTPGQYGKQAASPAENLIAWP